jgi:hypothetical protein
VTEDPYSLERLQDTTDARRKAIDRLMNPDNPTPNVEGVAVGIKYRGGEPTGEQPIIVFVSVKVDEEFLRPDDRIPAEIQGFPTDVREAGQIAPEY